MYDWSGIRTHASEETSALNWRLGPLGHPTLRVHRLVDASGCTAAESSGWWEKKKKKKHMHDWSGIRTHASEETSA